MRTLLLVVLLLPFTAHAKKPAPPPPAAWKCGDEVSDDYGTGFTALNAGKNDEAVVAFADVLAKEPQCGLALIGQGRALLAGGKPKEAEVPLTAATAAFADKPDGFVWLGRAKAASGDDEGALAAARAAIVVKPNSVDAQRLAQDALLRKGDIAGARAMLDAARATSNVVTWYCLEGMLAVTEGDVPKAQGLLVQCEGVPDRTVYDTLAARIAAAPAPAGAVPVPAVSAPATPPK
ncbi:MAG: tetratricopeptide repeat protein [Pseudomonadota bacterium]|nr:tetratricopeptide repeat protein [Pseudomonadota bacterium]